MSFDSNTIDTSLSSAILLPKLGFSLCQLIIQLSNPNGRGCLKEEDLQAVLASLNETCGYLKVFINQSTDASSGDAVLIFDAVKAAIEVIENLHQPV